MVEIYIRQSVYSSSSGASRACRHVLSHIPGVPSPALGCFFWTGAAGSCPYGDKCAKKVWHVLGQASPALLPRLQQQLPSAAAPDAAPAAALPAAGDSTADGQSSNAVREGCTSWNGEEGSCPEGAACRYSQLLDLACPLRYHRDRMPCMPSAGPTPSVREWRATAIPYNGMKTGPVSNLACRSFHAGLRRTIDWVC